MNIIDKSVANTTTASDMKGMRGTSAGTSQSSAGVVTNSNAIRQTAPITGNMLLAQMLPGESFSGDIIDVRGSAIRILLGNDKMLDAAATDAKNLNIGDHITFNVASNNGKTVVIKPLKINTFNTNVLLKALEAAEAPANDKNIEIVKAMMKNEMSIDKDTLGAMLKKVEGLKTDNPENIVAMERHEIPLTQENLEQFTAYKNYEHRIIAQAETVAEEIPEMLKEMANTGDEQQVSRLAEKLINILDDSTPDNGIVSESREGTVLLKNIQTQNSETISQAHQEAQKISEDDENYLNKLGLTEDGVVFENTSESAIQEKANLTKEQVINNLGMLKGDELKEFLDSPEFKDFVKEKVEKAFELNVNKLGQNDEEISETVKKLYKNIDSKTEAILNALENAAQRDTNLGQTTSNIRNNMQFMQDLSQMAAYVQLPIKFNESKAHGELYVFNRKKGMPVDKDVVTAFLHLDMDNLGATDVNVTLEKKGLKTEFSLSDKLSMEIVEEHLHELKERLETKGYIVTLTVELEPEKTQINPFDTALETDMPQISIKRYSFDVRA